MPLTTGAYEAIAAESLGSNGFRVEVLHEFRVLAPGRTLALSSGAERLVAWLSLQDRPRNRRIAASTLWPERSDQDAAVALRRALWMLNRVAFGMVTRDAQHVGLADMTTVDISEVYELGASVQEGDLQGNARTIRLLECDLLPEWSYDWLLVPREALRQLRLHTLETLACNRLDAGRAGEALAAALAAVAVEPLRESAHRRAISIHLAEGNITEALRQYNSYRDLLWAELNLRPGPDLERMLGLDSGPDRLRSRRQQG